MDFDEYQAKTRTTATYPEAFTGSRRAVNYCMVGLAGEVGEIMNKWKKILRGDAGTLPERAAIEKSVRFKNEMLDELGDVAWYLARAAEELGMDLDVIATRNIEKLASRKERGPIQGNGDDR
jgi:NTP pyrophosphatase (non-canonical NTP hydrolase)